MCGLDHVILNAMRGIVKGGAHAAAGVDVPEFVGKRRAWDLGCSWLLRLHDYAWGLTSTGVEGQNQSNRY